MVACPKCKKSFKGWSVMARHCFYKHLGHGWCWCGQKFTCDVKGYKSFGQHLRMQKDLALHVAMNVVAEA